MSTHPGSPNQLEIAPVVSVRGELGVVSLQERLQLLDMDSPRVPLGGEFKAAWIHQKLK